MNIGTGGGAKKPPVKSRSSVISVGNKITAVKSDVKSSNSVGRIVSSDNFLQKTSVVEDVKFGTREAIGRFLTTIGSQKSLVAFMNAENELQNQQVVDMILTILRFILDAGVIDPRESVRSSMLVAGRSIIDGYATLSSDSSLASNELINAMRSHIEAVLTIKCASTDPTELEEFDHRRVANHLCIFFF
jgi:hypothetical protein